jgi:hypothetical protein
MLASQGCVLREWCKNSFDYYHGLLSGTDGGKAGIFQASGYQLFNDERAVGLVLPASLQLVLKPLFVR